MSDIVERLLAIRGVDGGTSLRELCAQAAAAIVEQRVEIERILAQAAAEIERLREERRIEIQSLAAERDAALARVAELEAVTKSQSAIPATEKTSQAGGG